MQPSRQIVLDSAWFSPEIVSAIEQQVDGLRQLDETRATIVSNIQKLLGGTAPATPTGGKGAVCAPPKAGGMSADVTRLRTLQALRGKPPMTVAELRKAINLPPGQNDVYTKRLSRMVHEEGVVEISQPTLITDATTGRQMWVHYYTITAAGTEYLAKRK